MIKRSDHKCSTICILGVIEVAASASCGFTCVVLAGTSEGLAGPRVLEEARYRCLGTG